MIESPTKVFTHPVLDPIRIYLHGQCPYSSTSTSSAATRCLGPLYTHHILNDLVIKCHM